MTVFKKRKLALRAAVWDTKIFVGIRDTMHRKMGSSPPKWMVVLYSDIRRLKEVLFKGENGSVGGCIVG